MEEPLILDRYRPLADLGEGGYGSVTLAFDTKMARRVAIKRLPLPGGRTDGPLIRTGLAEARTAAMLNHPSIVTVHEWDTDADEAFIVMEHIDGASLAELLDADGVPLDDDEAAAVLDAVASALGFAHDNGVLHLDLKPGNVLVARDGRVKVADFGIAALTDSSGRARGSAGTIGYMPPEQLRGEPLDERTDVWAFAALMYELLTDANPFDADSAEGSLFRIEIAEVPAPSEFEPSLGVGIDDVLLGALAPEPAERYATVARFADDLSPLLGDPRAGQRALAGRVAAVLGEEDEAEPFAPPGLWDSLAHHAPAARRVAGAAVSGWLAATGLGAAGIGGGAASGAGAVAGLAGALAPGLGLALGIGSAAAGIAVAADWRLGVLAAALLGVPWALRWRRGDGDALLPFVAPALGAVRAGALAPLLAGFLFPPLQATLAGGASGVLLMLVAAATGASWPLLAPGLAWLVAPATAGVGTVAFLTALARPGLLVIAAAWALAAALTSLGCARASRAGATLGVSAGLAAMAGGYLAAAALAGDPRLALLAAPDLGIAATIMAAVIAAGPPVRTGR